MEKEEFCALCDYGPNSFNRCPAEKEQEVLVRSGHCTLSRLMGVKIITDKKDIYIEPTKMIYVSGMAVPCGGYSIPRKNTQLLRQEIQEYIDKKLTRYDGNPRSGEPPQNPIDIVEAQQKLAQHNKQ